jgi:predicted NAD-dependent protein-ADP-ribosyltransferase YbiA (DUF1768 family)
MTIVVGLIPGLIVLLSLLSIGAVAGIIAGIVHFVYKRQKADAPAESPKSPGSDVKVGSKAKAVGKGKARVEERIVRGPNQAAYGAFAPISPKCVRDKADNVVLRYQPEHPYAKPPITSFADEYDFLSNFHKCFVAIGTGSNAVAYWSSEAAFQAAKTRDPSERRKIAGLSAEDAAKEGRRINLRSDWEIIPAGIQHGEPVKIHAMRMAVRAKFGQNPELLAKLLDTEGCELIEGNKHGDREWGMVPGNGGKLEGKNMLGIVLMQERDRFLKLIKNHDIQDPRLSATL